MGRRLLIVLVGAALVGGGTLAVKHWRGVRVVGETLDFATLVAEHAWLADVSVWSEEAEVAEGWPARQALGAYPLGNGRVFTTLGLELPLNTLENTVGPTYQKTTGFLGRIVVGLAVGGRLVPLGSQRVERVRGSSVAHTVCAGADAVLETYDFIPPDLPAICRLLVARNKSEGGRRLSAVLLCEEVPLDWEGGAARVVRGAMRLRPVVQTGKMKVAERTDVVEADATTGKSSVGRGARFEIPFGRVAPGDARAKLVGLVITTDDAAEREAVAALRNRSVSELLAATQQHWRGWLDGGVSVVSGDARVDDLIEDEALIIRTQQAMGGGFSPMYRYSYCWARDSNGPIRYLSHVGQFGAVRKALDYYYEASARAGKIPNNHPLDVDVGADRPEVDWGKVEVEPAEVPSFLILQHHWYWRASGDAEPVRRHWAYLRRCLLGQEVSADGRLPFHGDETYRFPGYEMFKAGRGEPKTYLSMDLYSADSAFEYVAAAEALAEMAPAVGRAEEVGDYLARARRVREATERHYWQPERGFYAPATSRLSSERYQFPFANIALRPLWLGYADAESASAAENALNALAYLWRKDGTADLLPGFGYTVGMTPGMVLYSLAALDHPDAARALEGVLAAFSKSAGMSEMLTPDNKPAPEDAFWGRTRIRPWEGGINADAVLFYLTGFRPNAPAGRVELCPHTTPGSSRLTVRGLPVGASRLGVQFTRESERAVYRLDPRGAAALTAELTASLPASRVTGVSVGGAKLASRGDAVSRFGRTRLPLVLELMEGSEAVVVVTYEPTGAAPAAISRRTFDYLPPDLGGARTVLVTGHPDTVKEWRARRARLFVIDTNIAFPPRYLQGALFEADGGRRVDELVLDVAKFEGSFKPGFWSEGGPGARIVAEFERAGGRVVHLPGRPKPPSRLAL